MGGQVTMIGLCWELKISEEFIETLDKVLLEVGVCDRIIWAPSHTLQFKCG